MNSAMSLGLNMSSTFRLAHPFILAGIAYVATTNPINILSAILEASVPDDTDAVSDGVSDIEQPESASVIVSPIQRLLLYRTTY